MKQLFTFSVVFLFLFTINAFAQWEYWEANQLPTASEDSAWHFEQEADGQTIAFSTIIDDPDIPGNKLLQFDEPNGTAKETFANNWNAVPSIGATLVFRMKALQVGKYNRDWDIYIYNGTVRERLVSNSGKEIKFDKSKAAIEFDTSDWHIYRLTIIEDQIELFIDEDPLSFILTTGEASAENLFRIGDLGSSSIGTLYDWIAWDVSGAYPPGKGEPLPSVLTGLPTAVENISHPIPEKFELMQNFPNPFNPLTDIRFNLAEKSDVAVKIYDLNGKLVQTLVSGTKPAGYHRVQWDGLDSNGMPVPSGNYFCKLKAGNSVLSRKMILLK